MTRRAAAMKISRYLGDRLLATDRLERHRAFPGSGNALYWDFLENHFYRERGCLNDNSFILTKIFPTPPDGCSLSVNRLLSSVFYHVEVGTGTSCRPSSLASRLRAYSLVLRTCSS